MKPRHYVSMEWSVIHDNPIQLRAIIVQRCDLGICPSKKENIPLSWQPPRTLAGFKIVAPRAL